MYIIHYSAHFPKNKYLCSRVSKTDLKAIVSASKLYNTFINYLLSLHFLSQMVET